MAISWQLQLLISKVFEFFFAHTIGPLFTVILLPLVTLIIAGSIDMLFVYALLPNLFNYLVLLFLF